MANSRTLEDTLAAIGQLRREPVTPQTIDTLRKALLARSSHVVAKAAQVSGELGLRAIVADVAAAFDRFLVNPVKSDPGCRAKVEIARALYELGEDPADVFPRGVRHRQMEPVFGGREDTAAELRCVCALGLVRLQSPDALVELAELLADPEAAARAGAARAIAYADDPAGEPLLRLRALAGEPDPSVLTEILGALLSLAPVRSLPFLERLLDHREVATQEAAAVALGASRLREALPVLGVWWDRTADVDLRRTALLAIAMLRHDDAIAFLLSQVAEGRGPDARDAVAALGTYRHDDGLRARVEAAVERRSDVDLRPAYAHSFRAIGDPR
jgi:HEAT repeat protein